MLIGASRVPFSRLRPCSAAVGDLDEEAFILVTDKGGKEALDSEESAAEMDWAGVGTVSFLDFGFFAGGLERARDIVRIW